ncbi:MAG TPA: FAD-dependent oxidoreductase, partial [Mycobacterium sp.]|nr:FAD-dependent oxidoreductase [Mycobacterium sp.]
VVTTEGEEFEAATVVVTVNAWAPKLLNSMVDLPQITVTQEQPAFFAPLDPDAEWPSFIRYEGDGTSASDFACYGLSSPAENGVKVGEHGTGVPVDPDGDRPPVDAERLERLSAYVRDHLPGLVPDPIGATRCLYATTPTEDFILDRVGSVVVGAGFSGHGFKFTPAIGRVLADLAGGELAPAPRWSLPMASGRSWLPPQ